MTMQFTQRVPPAPSAESYDNPMVTVQQAIGQLIHALTLLHYVAEEGLANHALGLPLSHSARQAEAAMQRLRALSLPMTGAWIELTDALTVVVLAADMLSEGQLTSALTLDMSALLRRNAGRALHSLGAVRPQPSPLR